MKVNWLYRITGIMVGIITILFVTAIVVVILHLFPADSSERYVIDTSSIKMKHSREQIFCVRHSGKMIISITQCGEVHRKKGEADVLVYAEYARYLDRGDSLYHFQNTLTNYQHLFPLEKLLPHANQILKSFMDDIGNLLSSPYFNSTYVPRITALLKKHLNALQKSPAIQKRLNRILSSVKKDAGKQLSEGDLGKELKKQAMKGAKKYLLARGCVMLRSPYIKDRCMNSFMDWYLKKISSSKKIEKSIQELARDVANDPQLRKTLILAARMFATSLAEDPELKRLGRDILEDKEVIAFLDPTFELTATVLREEVPPLFMEGKTFTPVVFLLVRESFINRRKAFWLSFHQKVPKPLRKKSAVLRSRDE